MTELTIPQGAHVVLPPHGYVHLQAFHASDLDIVNAARVSMANESDWNLAPEYQRRKRQYEVIKPGILNERDAGLIGYLMKNQHGTPFEQNFFKFQVRAPIFVFREWHRHRIGYCVAGDTKISFVHKDGSIMKHKQTIEDLWRIQEGMVYQDNTTTVEVVEQIQTMRQAEKSDREISRETGIARGTLDRVRRGRGSDYSEYLRRIVFQKNLRVMDEETGYFTTGHVSEIIQSGIKSLFKLQTDKKELRCTADHQIWTPEGWIKVKDLKQGDLVAIAGVKYDSNPTVNARLREGIGIWTQQQRDLILREIDVCYICKKEFVKKDLHLDHIIPVVADLNKALDISNLSPCCQKCHKHKNQTEIFLYKKAKAAPGAIFKPLLFDPMPDGEEMTYDLCATAPNHNFVANGFIVHNSINEESGRYSQLKPDFYIPEAEQVRTQTGKPGAYTFEPADPITAAKARIQVEEASIAAYVEYENQLNNGIAKEVARLVLPVNIYSTMIWTCNARSLMSFLKLRNHKDAQWEIQQYAAAMEDDLKRVMPYTHAAFLENGHVAP